MLRQPKPKILILENQMIIAADVALQLLKLGCDVVGIHTRADDLLKTIENNRPDIVLMNIKMQSAEGRIRAATIISKTFRIPVIFLSAHTGREIFKQVINAQPYAFITKPFDIKDLQRGLKNALDRMTTEGFWTENARSAPLKSIDNVPSDFTIKPFGKRGLPFGQKLKNQLNAWLISR